MLAALGAAVPDGVRARALDRLAYAHDASHVLLTPQAVVVPHDAAEVAALFATATAEGVPLTFRSGGTSLSGQAVTDGVLVDTRRWFRDVEVLDDGARVRVQPGVTLRAVNARLARHGRRLGPDPASEAACTMGGVIANNSSGMTCGTERNTYRTIESAVVVLPSGTVLDTARSDADDELLRREPALHAALVALRDHVRADLAKVAGIRDRFALKNTMGYGINALLDHETPAQILARLMVGSEGTLGFVASAVLRTVPALPLAATGLLVFERLGEAMAALPALIEAGAVAVELLDAASLRVAAADPGAPASLRALTVRDHAALLVEWQEAEPDLLEQGVAAGRARIAGLPLVLPAPLTRDVRERAALWAIRKGLYASVAGARPSGTTALLEDIAVPVPALVDTCAALTELFARHAYGEAVIFGHARDGNLHFMLTERFAAHTVPERHARFMDDMVDLVLAQGGTLKAEHGTGRVMAPFVERQYGPELYPVHVAIKRAFDPAGVLSPGVIIGDDPRAHLKHHKTAPAVEAEVERCVECGYCEPVCPSRDLTTTPRQRIVLRRELARARAAGDRALVAELEAAQDYDVVQTCAADGLCATACPVRIDTGKLVKELRAADHSRAGRAVWGLAAEHWDPATRLVGRALDIAAVFPDALPAAATGVARRVAGTETVPAWSGDLPRGGRRRHATHDAGTADALFLPSCTGTMFGAARGGRPVAAALTDLAARAGVRLQVPDGISRLCCGTPWTSKGLDVTPMASRVRAALTPALARRSIPVVVDAASCTEGYRHLLAGEGPAPAVVDAVAWAAEVLLPRLTVRRTLGSLALHPTCSSTKLGLDAALMTIASAIAERVVVPDGWGCCGFAGDRGMLHPELTAAATRAEAAAARAEPYDAFASVNRPCEIAMTRATGRSYRHILDLLDEATR
ncbi:MAG: FAD-binding and (Fe-S)-binding domain-containing protein [Chloroflexota bacterium]